MGAAIDVATGRVVMIPFSLCCAYPTDPDFRAIDFRVSSRLIAFSGLKNEDPPMGTHYYEFDGKAFRFVFTVPNDGSFSKK
jgi:hypothetical protein